MWCFPAPPTRYFFRDGTPGCAGGCLPEPARVGPVPVYSHLGNSSGINLNKVNKNKSCFEMGVGGQEMYVYGVKLESRWNGLYNKESSSPFISTPPESDVCLIQPKKRMEMDYNSMDLSNNTGVEDNSEFKDFEGTDVKDMRLEAEAVVNDVLFAVSNMFVSKSLPCAEDVAYINVETRERNRYCLELTEAGLRVVGYAFDQVDDSVQNPYHETVYSLLDSVSPAYREAFGNALLQRLEALKSDGQS
ncbi:GSK3B-interacting protein isoform X1 [Zootoca vivipara]|uniref:GSK3B-interacting protein isoform X1 n=2 Tax=Lacertinae TaxID=162266 RepID=UPI0015918F89|nr:GSK3B-interacting protein isoform X1 [Zootoca vivipara]